MTSQFVILHHRLAEGEHWDLMLEHGDVLLTWQLVREPVDSSAFPIEARRIGNHRTAYLAYEGPLSGDRGDVRRIDLGPVRIRELTDHQCGFTASGRVLRGEYMLRHVTADHWWLGPR